MMETGSPVRQALQALVIAFASAGAAEGAPVDEDFTVEVDSLAALGADHTRAFEAGEIFRRNFHLDPLLVEKNVIGKLRVGFLLAGLLFESGEHFAGRLFRRFLRGDADRAAVF